MNIEWQDSYCIDNDRIDAQHRQLFAQANAVFEMNGQAGQRLAIMQLYAHIRTHFADEEALMREVKFPEYMSHRQLHNDMLARMNAISASIGRKHATDEEVRSFMTEWLLGHIAQEDAKIAAYVRQLTC
ncbi:MAG: hemerythrin family protein [Polaromonas sp.]|jgi:hemerythrin-like metal-binding protein|uniref:bacteriohemerythrin n=1 Tax=Polaromonas sp. TaxID=1869339 RepID=UPI0025D751D8|nr:hemerythrin family protein [Polaromonas sp.]MBI2725517.1 hemerythrin family protein [Polaromonas sp.]